jgi:hypothetical protein
MNLTIKRYQRTDRGTTGLLYINRKFICYTIELPWRENQRMISCIPEGIYDLRMHRSPTFGDVIHITNVPGRSWIYFHAANNALTELKGCIAPVTNPTGPGRGTASRPALNLFYETVRRELETERVTLSIINL